MAPAKHHSQASPTKTLAAGLVQAENRNLESVPSRLKPWEERLQGVNQLALLEQALRMAADAEDRLRAQAERIAKLEVLTMTDELTGLLNRRGFDAQLSRAIASSNRNKTTGVLAISDVDNFKKINDRYGHPIGDEFLRSVAHRILANVRETDYVARIGGDEFAILMSETEISYGLRRLNSLNSLLMRSVVPLRGHHIPLQISFGVESFGPGDKKKDLIKRADAAMFQSKRLRNQAPPRIVTI